MNLFQGVLLTIVAGILAGNCMLPMKFLRRWEWENAWFVFTLVSLLFLPWMLAATFVTNLATVYVALSWRQILVPAGFGFGWGIAQVLFGLSIARLGLALGYAVIIGLGAVLGTLVPLFVQSRDTLDAGQLALLLSGVAAMVAGIAVSAWAGKRRESGQREKGPTTSGNYAVALALAILCGFMAPMLNYAFAFGQDIAQAAVRHGNSNARAAYAVWPVGLAGGLIPNLAYSVYLLTGRRTWDRFIPSRGEAWLASLMGVLWMGSMACYGVAASFLGSLGTSIGWALFQIFMIMTANASGMLTGEWRGASRAARRLLWVGFGLLALATLIISTANAAK